MPVARLFRDDAGFRALIFVLGFLLSWLPLALAAPNLPAVDELFQFLEPGHRLAFGYGMVPWEFDYDARSWLLGAASALPMGVAGLLDAGPGIYLPLVWAAFSLLAAASVLCAGLWGARLFGRWGGLATALVAASWIDNLAFGGRVLSETVSAHLLIVAVYLAEPGYAVANRNRLVLSGLLATLAVLLRLQLGPAALLLWLWRWRDRPRLLLLSAGAAMALLLDGAFDTIATGYPFQPLWMNLRFNLLLHGAAVFGEPSWWYYLDEVWTRWGWTALPFAALALLGGRRLPLLAAMAAALLLVHQLVPHKEYRFLLPAVMMAAILCGLGAGEAARTLAALAARKGGPRAGFAAIALAALAWCGLAGANAMALSGEGPWRGPASLLGMAQEVGRDPAICGVGFGNLTRYETGGYTFLHRPIRLYHSQGADQADFIRLRTAYNALVIRKDDMDFFQSLHAFDGYVLAHCNDSACLFVRPGRCAAAPVPRPPVGTLTPETALDRRYPYAAGIPLQK